MNNSLDNFFKKINNLEYRIVFLTIYFVGVITLYMATKESASPLMMLALSIVLMVIYGIYAYSFVDNINVNQIADSAYFLGFLFTLSSITMSLINYASVDGDSEIQIGKIVNLFGFALATTILGLLIKLMIENIKPSVSDLTDKTFSDFERTVSNFDLQLISSAEKFKTFQDLVIGQLEKHAENITDQLDVVVNQTTQTLTKYIKESGSSLSDSMRESGENFSNALNKASNEMDLPTDFFTDQIKGPLINMKDQINSFNSELSAVIKSQGAIAKNTEKVSKIVEKLALKMDLSEKMPEYIEVIEQSVNGINMITESLNKTTQKVNEISQAFSEVVEGEKTKLIQTNVMREQMVLDLEFFQNYKKEMKDSLTKSTQYIEILKSELADAAELIVKKLG
jgi:hypothetical protein